MIEGSQAEQKDVLLRALLIYGMKWMAGLQWKNTGSVMPAVAAAGSPALPWAEKENGFTGKGNVLHVTSYNFILGGLIFFLLFTDKFFLFHI